MKYCIYKIRKVSMIIFISMYMLFCSTIFQNSSYAKTMKYRFAFNGEEYLILTEENDTNVDDQDEYVHIIDRFSNITYTYGEQVNEDTFYKTMRARYEGIFEYYNKTGEYVEDRAVKIIDGSKEKKFINPEILLGLIEMYMEDTKRIDNQAILNEVKYLIKPEGKNTFLTVTKVGKTYEKGGSKRYDEQIRKIESKSDIKSSDKDNNPFYAQTGLKYSSYLTYNGKVLNDLITDEELIVMLKRLGRTGITNFEKQTGCVIQIEETTDTQVSSGKISASLKKQYNKTYIEIYKQGTLAKRFLIAEDGAEKVYSNSTTVSNYVGLDNSKLKIKNSKPTSGYPDTYLMYYTDDNKTIDQYKDYVVMAEIGSNSIGVYQRNMSDGDSLKKVDTVIKDAQYMKIRLYMNKNWFVEYEYEEGKSGFFNIYNSPTATSPKYIIGINNWSMCYIDGKKYFDILMPLILPGNGITYDGISLNAGTKNVFISSDTDVVKDYETANSSYLATGDLLRKLDDYSSNVYLGIYSNKNKGRNMGSTKAEPVKVDEVYELYEDNGTKMMFPIKPFILIDQNMVDNFNKFQEMQTAMVTGEYSDNLVQEANYSLIISYMEDVIKILKPAIMLIILLFLLITGITGIIESKKPDARAAMMEKYKNIFIGVIFFACALTILMLIIEYTTQSFSFFDIPDKAEALIAQTQKEIQSPEENVLIGLIDLCLDLATFVMDMINKVCIKVLSNNASDMDVIKLIYNVRENGVVSRDMPFDVNGVEWTRYMTGYKALVGVGLLLMLVAIIKMSIEYIVFAGDEKKVAEIKETFLRIVKACLIIALTPYGVKLLLYIFNILTSLLPVNYTSGNFELAFPYSGILRTVMNFTFVSLKFKIYFVFLIRKIMISLLLIVTPIVAATWAISEKFESISIWIGELITNIALQFAYACGFMVLIIMSYEGQSNEIGLVLLIISMQMSKFIKDSMQGFFNEWGGFDEEGMADELSQKVNEAKQKVKGTLKKTGSLLVSASKFFDKDQKTNIGRRTSNAGNIMSGNFLAIQTKADTISNISRGEKITIAKNEYNGYKTIYEAEKANLSFKEREDVEKVEKGWKRMSKSEQEDIRKKGGAYAALYDVKEKEGKWHEKLLEEAAIRREADRYREHGIINKVRTYGERATNKEMDKYIQKQREKNEQAGTQSQNEIDSFSRRTQEENAYSTEGQEVVMNNVQQAMNYATESRRKVEDKQNTAMYVDKYSTANEPAKEMPVDVKNKFEEIDDITNRNRTPANAQQMKEQNERLKREVVQGYFEKQFNDIVSLAKNNNNLFDGDYSHVTQALFNNYKKQLLDMSSYIGPEVNEKIREQEEKLREIHEQEGAKAFTLSREDEIMMRYSKETN